MPQRFDSIKRLLDDVERKGSLFLETMLQNERIEVMVGVLPITNDEQDRPTFVFTPQRYPAWFEVYLSSKVRNEPEAIKVGISLDYPEFYQDYYNVRNFQFKSAATGGVLDVTDALEGLILATVAKDSREADALITKLIQLEPKPEMILPLLGRGNTRIRAAIGRVMAGIDNETVQYQLYEALREEPAEGVRAEIIMALVRQRYLKGIPEAVVGEWLGSENPVDVLAYILGVVEFSNLMPISRLTRINPRYREFFRPWFEQK